MGLLDHLFGRGRRVTEDNATVELTAPKGPALRVGNVQGLGARERQEDSFAILNAADPEALERQGLFAVVCDGMGGMADGNDAIEAARKDKEDDLLLSCRAIEEYFDFPEPNELVKKAQIPGGMYTNMVAQLKQLGQIDLLEKAMSLIPQVRMDAGLPPLVTPTSQIIGAQAVSCALDELKGRPMYSNPSNQFIALVKGEYGKTPIPVDPAFRLKIAGVQNEVPYDGSHYVMQENPVLEDLDVLLAENEKEILLLELFPTVARTFLTKWKEQKARSTV